MPKYPTKRPWPADRSSAPRGEDRPRSTDRPDSGQGPDRGPDRGPARSPDRGFERPPARRPFLGPDRGTDRSRGRDTDRGFGDRPSFDKASFKPNMADRLAEIDAELTRLLAKRADLYGKLLAKERGRRSDKGVEPRLWAIWESQLREQALDPKLWRQIFSLTNSLSFELAGAGAANESFALQPGRGDIEIDLPGPASTWQTQARIFLASAAAKPLALEGINLSDPLFELCKALNQAGAELTWESGVVRKPAGSPLQFDNAALFCGRDAFNFYLPLCLALGPGGRTKLSGAAELKGLDLLPLGRVLTRLGGRMSNLDPKSKGLPVRLETGGITTEELVLDDAELRELPVEFIRALALSAWSYPQGLRLKWTDAPGGPGEALTDALRPVAALLRDGGAHVKFAPGLMTVPAAANGLPALPERPVVDLDPLLCAVLLAMPQASRRPRGRVRLSGRWPADDVLATSALALLKAAGARVEVFEEGVEVTAGPAPTAPLLTPGRPALFSLALALGATSPTGAQIVVPAGLDAEARRAGVSLLAKLGATFNQETGRIVIERPAATQFGGFGEPWLAPDAPFAMAIALAGLSLPGMALANSGLVAAAWPAFWTIYAKLPIVTAQSLVKKEEEEAVDAGKSKRRIRIGRDSDAGE